MSDLPGFPAVFEAIPRLGRCGIHLNVASGREVRGMVVDLETLRHEVVR